MSHQHDHPHSPNTNNFALVFFINLSFTLIEIIGGFLTNSISIWADALHDLGDTLSLGISWKLEAISYKKRDVKFSFGYKRFSLLGALINGIILLIGTFIILFKAIPRLFYLEDVHSEGMFGLAILGILVNGFAALRLRKKNSINESVMSLHLLEDILGWTAVLITSIAIHFGNFVILDPILSILIALFIIYNAVKRIKKTLFIFLQSIPPEIDLNSLENSLRQIDMVKGIHDTHIWSLDGNFHIITTHVMIPKEANPTQALKVKCEIREKICQQGIEHATIEIEYEGESCQNICR